ncbi:MAG: response regulator [Planctomycetes bacterium]|nr:response regulator [Planctomycetota bacterium]
MKPNGTDAAQGPLVLAVEDEEPVLRFLRTGLASQGYRVIESGTGKDALRSAVQYVPDVVLLDLGLPDMDGLQVLASLRAWSRVPVIVLSARGQERAKVEALDAGADDYLTKPFGFPELLARMRVALRHAVRTQGAGEERVFASGGLEIDLVDRRVKLGERDVHLTPIEFKLLAALARHAGRVVTHKQLLEEVWGPQCVNESQYLRVHMTHLRRKLERGPAEPRVFETEAGVGYRLRLPEGE